MSPESGSTVGTIGVMQGTRGFTLIEILVVITIIGILSAVVFSALNDARARSRNATYISQVREYQKALALYYSERGSYPGSGAWGCVGTGYPGGICWNSSGYNESNSTSVALRTALGPYIDESKIPGPSDRTYGPMYRTNSAGYDLIVILEGEVSCPVGTKQTAPEYVAAGITRCNVTSQGL